MSSTARNRTFLAPFGVGYKGLYGLFINVHENEHKFVISHYSKDLPKPPCLEAGVKQNTGIKSVKGNVLKQT